MSQRTTEFLTEPPIQRKSLAQLTGRVAKRVLYPLIGSLMCLTPVTAVLVLGWLSQYCRQRVIQAVLNRGLELIEDVKLPSHGSSKNATLIAGNAPSTFRRWPRFLSHLKRNTLIGLRTYSVLFVSTSPFVLLWLFSWWAGWENSFNKGYEQAWVGPVTGIVGTVLALYLLNFIPFAFVHGALFDTWRSYFDIRAVAQIRRAAGWRFVGLVFLTVILSLPMFAAKTLPVFIEQIYPDFVHWDEAQLENFKNQMRLGAAAYVFFSLWFLKGLASRIYARAIIRLQSRSPAHASPGFPLVIPGNSVGCAGQPQPTRKVIGFLNRMLQATLVYSFWFVFVAQIFVSQFLNHNWVHWINHPLIQLPWFGAI